MRRDTDLELWARAVAVFTPAQLIEITALVGFYHLVSFTVNATGVAREPGTPGRLEEHTSELQSLMRILYAVFCLKKKNIMNHNRLTHKQSYQHLMSISTC